NQGQQRELSLPYISSLEKFYYSIYRWLEARKMKRGRLRASAFTFFEPALGAYFAAKPQKTGLCGAPLSLRTWPNGQVAFGPLQSLARPEQITLSAVISAAFKNHHLTHRKNPYTLTIMLKAAQTAYLHLSPQVTRLARFLLSLSLSLSL
ncbi:MAG: hypothetical protein LBC67_06145, partial [Spirochaetales bacterium]|nr:hypothetical protein [Spirochaetales bacterium]